MWRAGVRRAGGAVRILTMATTAPARPRTEAGSFLRHPSRAGWAEGAGNGSREPTERWFC